MEAAGGVLNTREGNDDDGIVSKASDFMGGELELCSVKHTRGV